MGRQPRADAVVIELVVQDFEAPLDKSGAGDKYFQICIDPIRRSTVAVQRLPTCNRGASGFIFAPGNKDEIYVLAETELGPLVMLGDKFFVLGDEVRNVVVGFTDYWLLRRFHARCGGLDEAFSKLYFTPWHKALMADALVAEFADFFKYLSMEWPKEFPGLKYFVKKQRGSF